MFGAAKKINPRNVLNQGSTTETKSKEKNVLKSDGFCLSVFDCELLTTFQTIDGEISEKILIFAGEKPPLPRLFLSVWRLVLAKMHSVNTTIPHESTSSNHSKLSSKKGFLFKFPLIGNTMRPDVLGNVTGLELGTRAKWPPPTVTTGKHSFPIFSIRFECHTKATRLMVNINYNAIGFADKIITLNNIKRSTHTSRYSF